ncbi:uncharacterized protein LAESUDRAFT_712965 [Laetiporus sulphureus 93-53]|uniref:Uncharacterized protein n=1 Tax=Laetiporus sulphureus 93-53 TaxID=1314785 RepID=A0A165F651_9APHY|nr:uncharacterized protein LAESUDRAFT_712965 [Laetiporus sulphureus 93-53]KZT08467.1 hypothetical protein LAESUDRAFT_712965 [Laetiporus sulphureus 93-53]
MPSWMESSCPRLNRSIVIGSKPPIKYGVTGVEIHFKMAFRLYKFQLKKKGQNLAAYLKTLCRSHGSSSIVPDYVNRIRELEQENGILLEQIALLRESSSFSRFTEDLAPASSQQHEQRPLRNSLDRFHFPAIVRSTTCAGPDCTFYDVRTCPHYRKYPELYPEYSVRTVLSMEDLFASSGMMGGYGYGYGVAGY